MNWPANSFPRLEFYYHSISFRTTKNRRIDLEFGALFFTGGMVWQAAGVTQCCSPTWAPMLSHPHRAGNHPPPDMGLCIGCILLTEGCCHALWWTQHLRHEGCSRDRECRDCEIQDYRVLVSWFWVFSGPKIIIFLPDLFPQVFVL